MAENYLDRILIIDFGSQYTQLIARRIREAGVFSEIKSPEITASEIEKRGLKGIILSGGPASVSENNAPRLDPSVFELRIPILGICYGLQLIARHFHGTIESSKAREYGKTRIQITKDHPLLKDVSNNSIVWMSHGDHLSMPPPGFAQIARTDNKVIAAFASDEKQIYALQFHPEVVHTEFGSQIIHNFLFRIARAEPTWTPELFIEKTINQIRQRVAGKKVLLAISGGVDSSVMAVLLHKAIGNHSIPVFINNGLLRKDEELQVISTLKKKLQIEIQSFDYSQRFLTALKNVTHPEKKRKIIGKLFIEAFEEIARQFQKVEFLAQGTLYPDVIESRSVKGPSAVIKSHHNVGGLPERLNLQLIEPLCDLFKDEVRKVGRSLGMPEVILNRHPFPGPGLAVRIIGKITRRKIRIIQEADHIFISKLKDWRLYDSVWQAFTVLLPVRSVGVMGDRRTYEYVCALRAVTSQDGMTADWFPFPAEFLSEVATAIVNNVKGINRVVYDITSKPPGTIEWE